MKTENISPVSSIGVPVLHFSQNRTWYSTARFFGIKMNYKTRVKYYSPPFILIQNTI